MRLCSFVGPEQVEEIANAGRFTIPFRGLRVIQEQPGSSAVKAGTAAQRHFPSTPFLNNRVPTILELVRKNKGAGFRIQQNSS
jgi:hypothetical protein